MLQLNEFYDKFIFINQSIFYFQIFPEHDDLNDRLSKNLYYGRETPSCDRLSLPITGEYCMK